MGIRRQAREVALQMVYMCDVLHSWDGAQARFCLEHFEVPPTIRPYAETLIDGVLGHRSEIDGKISCASEHWSLNRMSRLDRSLLRLATYEIFYLSDIPSSVAINEAIEISKRFGAKDSPMFVNGVLDKVASLLRIEVEVVPEAISSPSVFTPTSGVSVVVEPESDDGKPVKS